MNCSFRVSVVVLIVGLFLGSCDQGGSTSRGKVDRPNQQSPVLKEVARGTITVEFNSRLGPVQPNTTDPYVQTRIDLDKPGGSYGGNRTLEGGGDLELKLNLRKLTVILIPVGNQLVVNGSKSGGSYCLSAVNNAATSDKIFNENVPIGPLCASTSSGNVSSIKIGNLRHRDASGIRRVWIDITFTTWSSTA